MWLGKRAKHHRIKISRIIKSTILRTCGLVLFGTVVVIIVSPKVVGELSPTTHQGTPQTITKHANFPAAPVALLPGQPLRLMIPKITVNAPIEPVGLTQNGNMGVPSKANKVGWYENGQRPGEKGAAVLAGHLDGNEGESDVFTDLHKVGKGDSFQVTDDTGYTFHFIVTNMKVYNQDEKPAEVFTASDGIHVNLITCTGPWDKVLHRFTKRLVVFGEVAS